MLFPNPDRLGRVPPDELRRKNSVNDGRDRLRRTILPAFSPSDETRVRLDPNEVAVPFRESSLRRIELVRAERSPKDMRTDRFDFHGAPSPELATCAASNRSAIRR
jgi:hypothetical protein